MPLRPVSDKRRKKVRLAHNSTFAASGSRSAKREATKPLPQRKKLNSRNPRRREREFARTFHSAERVEWVKSMPCIVARVALKLTCKGPVQNAHVVKDGSEGTGRRGGYKCIAPVCKHHHIDCLHEFGPEVFENVYGVNLEAEAAGTQEAWLAFKGECE